MYHAACGADIGFCLETTTVTSRGTYKTSVSLLTSTRNKDTTAESRTTVNPLESIKSVIYESPKKHYLKSNYGLPEVGMKTDVGLIYRAI
jgi:hypothetical protein